MSTHYEGICDFCEEHSDFLRILGEAPFPPKLCPDCHAIASEVPDLFPVPPPQQSQ